MSFIIIIMIKCIIFIIINFLIIKNIIIIKEKS
jgi:hypothetical protein